MADKKPSLVRDVVKLTDLAPRQDVKGGSQRRVFGSDPIHPSKPGSKSEMKSSRRSEKTGKDLGPKSAGTVKGGGWTNNDNITLVDRRGPNNGG